MAGALPSLVLGVDGGATKTLALLSDPSGRVVGWARAGNCDIYSNRQGAAAELEAAVDAALAMAGVNRPAIATAVYSLVGADWPEDFDHWRRTLAWRKLGDHIVVINDAIGALYAAASDGDAVIVVCGTGAATGSRNAAGALWHSSFWQLTQGGGELGTRALDAVYRADLGLGPATQLTSRLLQLFEAASVEALLHSATRSKHDGQVNPAKVPPILFAAADSGDRVAIDILRSHGASLGDFAGIAAGKVGILEARFRLALAGGVLRNSSPILRDALLDRLLQQAPAFVCVDSDEPLRGAINLALMLHNNDRQDTIAANLDATFPPRSFFVTNDLPG